MALIWPKFKDLDLINGNTPFIIREIWVFPKISGISPFIFKHNKINIQL